MRIMLTYLLRCVILMVKIKEETLTTKYKYKTERIFIMLKTKTFSTTAFVGAHVAMVAALHIFVNFIG